MKMPLAIFHAWVYGPQVAPFAGGLAPIIALLLLNGKTTLSALGLSKVVINIGGGSCALLRVEVEPGLLEQENAKRSYQMKEQARNVVCYEANRRSTLFAKKPLKKLRSCRINRLFSDRRLLHPPKRIHQHPLAHRQNHWRRACVRAHWTRFSGRNISWRQGGSCVAALKRTAFPL